MSKNSETGMAKALKVGLAKFVADTAEREVVVDVQTDTEAKIAKGLKSGDFNNSGVIQQLSELKTKASLIPQKLEQLDTALEEDIAVIESGLGEARLVLERRAEALAEAAKVRLESFLTEFVPDQTERSMIVENIALKMPNAPREAASWCVWSCIRTAKESGKLPDLAQRTIEALEVEPTTK